MLVNPASSTYPSGGQGLLAGSAGGLVGLTCDPNAQTSCDLLRVWIADSSSELLTGDTHEIPTDKRVVDETFATSVAPTYDAAGNMTSDGVYRYKYDAWNRLVKVMRQGPTASPQVIATYRYDGLGHRIEKVVTNSGDKDRTEYFYCNKRWQLLEIADSSNKAKQQFVWGTQYIDEAICMDVDTDTSGTGYGDCTDTGGSRRFFYCQDANWNVVALRESTGSGSTVINTIVERYEYDPYGTVRICRGSATPGAIEQRTVAGQSLKWLDAALPENPVLYGGYFSNDETGLYHVRHRMYGRGTWLQRDSKEYKDGANQYLYVRGNPSSFLDPLGLETYCATLYDYRPLETDPDYPYGPVPYVYCYDLDIKCLPDGGAEVHFQFHDDKWIASFPIGIGIPIPCLPNGYNSVGFTEWIAVEADMRNSQHPCDPPTVGVRGEVSIVVKLVSFWEAGFFKSWSYCRKVLDFTIISVPYNCCRCADKPSPTPPRPRPTPIPPAPCATCRMG